MATKSRRLGVDGKQIIDIKEAWIDKSYTKPHYEFLWGRPENHPIESLNGIKIHTSPIKRVDGNLVETMNSIYNVLSWDEKKIHPQAELF